MSTAAVLAGIGARPDQRPYVVAARELAATHPAGERVGGNKSGRPNLTAKAHGVDMFVRCDRRRRDVPVEEKDGHLVCSGCDRRLRRLVTLRERRP